MANKKENECIEMFAKVLNTNNVLRNKGVFDFLRGDKGTKLRVDAYFKDFNLVVEYDGPQHTKSVKHFNRRPNREEQRKRYDELRNKFANEKKYTLIRYNYDEEINEENVRKKLVQKGILL